MRRRSSADIAPPEPSYHAKAVTASGASWQEARKIGQETHSLLAIQTGIIYLIAYDAGAI